MSKTFYHPILEIESIFAFLVKFYFKSVPLDSMMINNLQSKNNCIISIISLECALKILSNSL